MRAFLRKMLVRGAGGHEVDHGVYSAGGARWWALIVKLHFGAVVVLERVGHFDFGAAILEKMERTIFVFC